VAAVRVGMSMAGLAVVGGRSTGVYVCGTAMGVGVAVVVVVGTSERGGKLWCEYVRAATM
jgi:hypothetical protein